jgi:hypothetical protein
MDMGVTPAGLVRVAYTVVNQQRRVGASLHLAMCTDTACSGVVTKTLVARGVSNIVPSAEQPVPVRVAIRPDGCAVVIYSVAPLSSYANPRVGIVVCADELCINATNSIVTLNNTRFANGWSYGYLTRLELAIDPTTSHPIIAFEVDLQLGRVV